MKHLFCLVLFTAVVFSSDINGQNNPVDTNDKLPKEELLYPELVNEFYSLNGDQLFWIETGLRYKLLERIDSAYFSGLIQKKYHFGELRSYVSTSSNDSVTSKATDRLFTDAAIALCKDLYQGYKMSPWVGYDQLSPEYSNRDNEYLLKSILASSTADKFHSLTTSLEPSLPDYIILKNELKEQQEKGHSDTVRLLLLTINYFRWIHHFGFEKFIVVNLPEARLRYYEKDSAVLDMKTVVGKTSTPSPRFATICDQVILYPYWYVPRSITFNEYLPKIKRDPSWIDANNMQVIDGAGKVMDHLKMNWASYHAGYFPYTIRQSTGCDNALGVIKFNIISPYGVYLHDTNNKTAFLSGLRYYSHGCIRIEEPLELGNKMLYGKLDTTYLQSCFKEKKPEFIKLEHPVPVFSVYMQVVVDQLGKIHYYKDIYKLR